MAISANTLFRFVTDIQWLKKALKDCAFEPRYCIEYDKKQQDGSYYAIPMVCFCDITLTEINEHVNDYGCYGLGLAKQWAKKNISSVIYFNNQESLIRSLYRQLKGKIGDKQSALLCSLLKQYYGATWSSTTGKIRKKILYNERERRYVPRKISVKLLRISVKPPKDFKIENELVKNNRLRFTFDDIKYILVKSEEDRVDMIEFLRENILDTITCNILLSKILTLRQIEEDF